MIADLRAEDITFVVARLKGPMRTSFGPAGCLEAHRYPAVTSRPCAVSAQITAMSIAMMTIAATGE